KHNTTTGDITILTYIGGDAYTAPIVYRSSPSSGGGQGEDYLYLHRDYLGSILAITNQSKQVLEKYHFGAWGDLVYHEKDGTGVLIPFGDSAELLLDRGYTGHEHLQSVGLIHMNGRLYDP